MCIYVWTFVGVRMYFYTLLLFEYSLDGVLLLVYKLS